MGISKSLASFYSAKTIFDEDILRLYLMFIKKYLEKLVGVNSKIAIIIDSNWKNRYEGRSSDFLIEDEKVYQSSSTKSIRVGKGDIIGDEDILGESVGVFYFNISIIKKMKKNINENFDIQSSSISDLITYLANKNSFDLIDIKGEWAEMDSPADLIQFKFGTKADTLHRLKNKLSKSEILSQIKFTINDVKNDIDSIIKDIQKSFSERSLVVRSSALNEDTHTSSMAGNYQSVLNVNTKSKEAIEIAINEVSNSYLKGNQKEELMNQILIQPQLAEVKLSGVLFTKDLETSAPYYIINYDLSGKTDKITSGTQTDFSKTFIFSKNSKVKPKNNDLRKIISAAKEIEEVTGHDSLDIEFAIVKGKVIILQVRPIAAHKNALKVYNSDVELELNYIKSFIEKQQKKIPKLVGETTVFGVMPDWNPAEIIGINPYPLAFDLYKEIITDKDLAINQTKMGYRKINHHQACSRFRKALC